MNLGRRKYGHPILLDEEGLFIKPKRLPLEEKKFHEGWLQELIRKSPDILPITEIEPIFAPLIPVGIEVGTRAGSIDNLFISPQGYLTIIETKLWRNPQARREVVGQILDYAKDVSGWSFETLDAHMREYNKKFREVDQGIIETIRITEQIDEEDEADIIDAIGDNLKKGRFLLLIVGDGIRSSVEAMAEFLNQTPQLLFTLALVELQVYEIEENDKKRTLVVPQIVARTTEVVRAVIRVEGQAVGQVSIGIDTEPEVEKSRQGRFTLTEEEFFTSLAKRVPAEDLEFIRRLMSDMQELGLLVDWVQTGFVIKMPDPGGSGRNFTLFVVTAINTVYVGWLGMQLKRLGLPQEICFDFVINSASLFKNVRQNPKLPDGWTRSISIGELREHYAEFIELIREMITGIRKVSEPEE